MLDLRGPEGPLFHRRAGIFGFFAQPVKPRPFRAGFDQRLKVEFLADLIL
jgi:hypothetical protein